MFSFSVALNIVMADKSFNPLHSRYALLSGEHAYTNN